jgi:hypothetical protein
MPPLDVEKFHGEWNFFDYKPSATSAASTASNALISDP